MIDPSADVGRGVFAPGADEAFFDTVRIGRYGRSARSDEIELRPDAADGEIAGEAVSSTAAGRT